MAEHDVSGRRVELANARMTVVETVYYRKSDGELTEYDYRYSRELGQTEDPEQFERRYAVGTQWEKIETGWVESPAVVIVQNMGKEILQIHLGSQGEGVHLEIPPNEHQRLIPASYVPIYCRFIDSKYRIHVVAIPG